VEEVSVDIVLLAGGGDDLREPIQRPLQSGPPSLDEQRISKPSPVEPVLVHPVPVLPEEIRVEHIPPPARRILGGDFPQPIKDNVERALAESVDTLDGLAVLRGQLEVIVHIRADVDGVHDGVISVVVEEA